MALYIRECFDVIELEAGDDKVESLWVKIRGRADKAGILMGVCYRLPNQDEEKMRSSSSRWQKLRDHQSLSSWGTSTSLIYAGNTTQRRRSSLGFWSVWRITF